jgi:arsenite-transporting ATPase
VLHAVEIDARRALDRWLSGRREALERIALRGTWLDDEDVSRLLRLSLPGIDELAALFEIARYAATGRYDLLVVDTAPTGHTLRMLTTPGTLRGIAHVFDSMQAKHRVMVDALRGSWTPDAEDALIDELDRDGRDLAALLRDPGRVRVSWVTLAEPMAIEETADAAAALALQGIPLHDIIVNRLTPAPERRCGWCDGRRLLERRAAGELKNRLPGLPLIALAAREAEPRGTRALAGIGTELAARRSKDSLSAPQRGSRVGGPALSRGPRALFAPRGVLPLWRAKPSQLATKNQPGTKNEERRTKDEEPRTKNGKVSVDLTGTRLLLFGGKGGVGKTTCAAAVAMAMAAADPARQILLISTDPAHSLGDVFGSAVSNVPGRVPGGPPNLEVREIDAAGGLRQLRERYTAAIDELFDRLSRGSSAGVGVDAGHDREVMQGLIDLAPPGIDELAAVIDVADALVGDRAQDAYDLVVIDTAPSGHALRLLEMPALVQDWARALMAILLKYQPVMGVGELGAVLLKLSQGLGRLRALLADSRRVSFVAVTRGAALPRAETLRLIAALERMKVHVPAIVVNAAGRGTCARCRKESTAEAREIAKLRRSAGASRQVVIAPAQMPPPHRAPGLRRWHRTWTGQLKV